jgi:hypothetical protein
MKRREFITLLGARPAWPIARHAQQSTPRTVTIAILGAPTSLLLSADEVVE